MDASATSRQNSGIELVKSLIKDGFLKRHRVQKMTWIRLDTFSICSGSSFVPCSILVSRASMSRSFFFRFLSLLAGSDDSAASALVFEEAFCDDLLAAWKTVGYAN